MIRGSSTHTGARALRDYYQALVKDNLSPVITPDGPSGPRFKFKPGAHAAGADVGTADAADGVRGLARLAHQVGQVRDPGALCTHQHRLGEPRYVPRVADAAALARLQAEMEARLKALFAAAQAALGRG